MRNIHATLVGSVSALLIASSALAQTGGYSSSSQSPTNQGSMSNQSMSGMRHHQKSNMQPSGYANSGSPNSASTAISNLYQARDELNAMAASPHRDQALHHIYAALDEAKAISNASSSKPR